MNNKRIVSVLAVFSILFLSLMFYMTYMGVFNHDTYVQSAYNKRSEMIETKVLRGNIFDRNGTLIAYSEKDGDTTKRIYPYKNMYSHVIGYNSLEYGKSLLEKQYNMDLLNQDRLMNILSANGFINLQNSRGNDLNLTIDHKLQEKTYELMSGYKGAAVAINPKTGEILAMVSLPDFDPNEQSLKTNWQKLNSDQNSPFLTRATSGLYAPGSTYKVITTSLIYENNLEKEIVSDTDGKIKISDKFISNSENKAYGDTDIDKAFTKSSNVYYAKLGSVIPFNKHRDIAKRFLLGEDISLEIPLAKSSFETQNLNDLGLAIASIGQGSTVMTPIHMALMGAVIANSGKMPKPYIVKSVTKNGLTLSSAQQETIAQPIDEKTAEKIKQLMKNTVTYGTATGAKVNGIEICGKTGTSENELTQNDKTKTHAIFIGFAPFDNPEIAVCVLMENAGYGGTVAAPVAGEMFKTYFENK